ncbi:MAG: Rib/alpha-like domain-containing protein, partial [Peptoanaerobacter stomatis]|uniref:Rib/alpha-like domain-containing protein n=1 Tax=Peptoanaerobacter stomatis TaxID=796937 RepID=UPI003F9F067E
TVGEYNQGKSEYKKDKFELEIEDPSKIQSGSSKNVFGTFKFLTKEEVKQLDNKTYKDGVYYGDGFGFVERKPIPVKVTVSGGKITDISLVEEELTKVDTEWKPGQKAKIDDGEAYAMRFDIVNNLVKKNQNPNALAYRLGTLRDVYRLVRKGVGATDIAGYNANFDKIVGKHEFGSYNLKLQKGDEHNINNKLMSLLRTYAVEDLGYGKAEYDAISGATFTAIGTSQAISNALKKADDSISFYDMRIKDGYKEKFTEGTPIALSDLKVDFYQKDSTIKTVPYSQFEANGLKVLDRDTDKEIKNGTILSKENFGVSTLSVVNLKVVHEKSNSVKLLKKMTVLKGGVLCNVEKFQVKAKDSNEWIDTKGFNNTMTNGEVNYKQRLTVSYAKAHDLLHKELEFRIVAKRTDNNEEVIFTTHPSGASDKFIYPQKPKQDYRIFIDESSLKDANGTALKIDEKNSKYFRIFLKDDSTAPKLAETYKNAPHPITVTTGTMLTEEILKGAFDNLPQDSKINFDEQKAQELTVTAGDNKKLEVSVDFKDYSSKDYTLIINVKEEGHSTLAQQYNETPYTITVTTNTQLSVDRVKSALPNLPYNTDVQITKEADTSKIGNSEVQVRLIFTDNSTKDMTIPVIVKETAQGLAGKFEQNENALSMDAVVQLDSSILSKYSGYKKSIEDTMKLGLFNKKSIKEELRLRENVSHKEYGDIDNDIDIEIVKEPDQKTIGQKSAKIKLIFKKDGSELELDVPVNVTPIPVARFSIIPRYLKDMKKTYSIDDKFDFKGLKVMTTISSGKNANKWIDSGITIPLVYEDFEYFGLKVVKTGTNEEVKQGSPVKDALTDGKIDLSVFRELGVISQEEEQKKVPQIEGLELEKLAESFNKSSYATDGIEVEALVKPNDPKFQSLEIYSKKGFYSSRKIALKEIENKYGEVTVEEVSKPDLTQLGDTTAKIKLKFKDDSVSNEITVKVKVKELPVFRFIVNRMPKKQYNENDNIELDVISANVYIPKILDNKDKDYSVSDPEENPILKLLYKDFKYFGFTVVKKDTEEEVSNGTQVKDLPRDGKQIVLDALCKKVYAEDGKNRVPIYLFTLK